MLPTRSTNARFCTSRIAITGQAASVTILGRRGSSVDDLVDSRWTLTVVGAALLEAGSGHISPFVLANSVSD